MSQDFKEGDFLIFQIESGFGLLRILEIEKTEDETTWHLASFSDLFMDIETADAALENHESLTIEKPHVVLTNRAFEATQTARMKNVPLNENELKDLNEWKTKGGEVSDRSIRLMLGLR